jgi:hypothetical protein
MIRTSAEFTTEAAKGHVFPELYVSRESGTIILFTSPGVGTVICAKKEFYKPFHHSDTWSFHEFERFYGTIYIESTMDMA